LDAFPGANIEAIFSLLFDIAVEKLFKMVGSSKQRGTQNSAADGSEFRVVIFKSMEIGCNKQSRA
jgi:hypothetical protein